MALFNQTPSEVLNAQDSNLENGLSSEAVTLRQAQYGINELVQGQSLSILALLLAQLKNPLLIILAVGAVLSLLTEHYVDAIAITIIIFINAAIGFSQEYKAQKSIDALKNMAAPKCTVKRHGEWQVIAARELVPGDIVKLETGNIVPADCRLLETAQLDVDESALTGESDPVQKQVAALEDTELTLGDQINMVFTSTAITHGQGIGIVTATGMDTEVGKIASLMQSAATSMTPLQARVHRLSKVLIVAALILVMLIIAIGFMHGMDGATLMTTGISLAVAATPEGLLTVLTIVLTLGANRMMQNNALVRQLASVETLGSTSVICSDKTGTLTQNKMQVTQLWTGGRFFHVEGRGYEPEGQFLNHEHEPIHHSDIEHFNHLAHISVLCNDSDLKKAANEHTIIGTPTEGALLVTAAKADVSKISAAETYTTLERFPFDSKRKMMSVIVQDPDGQHWLFAKGAPDVLVQHSEAVQLDSKLGDMLSHKNAVENVIETFASQALRTLAIGYRKLSPDQIHLPYDDLEQDFTLLGIYGIMDPPRPEATQAVSECHHAGIRVTMITGDHASTAKAIALQMGILKDDSAQVLEGKHLNQLSDDELYQQVEHTAVFARVTPEHKLRIVQALQKHNYVVAMTGDGINDAPALRAADIGVAMGITGTGVSKESADLILLDDNFATIVEAVKEGRRIYDNIRKFIRQDLTTNVGEVSALLFAFVLMVEAPLLTLAPLMILWINLVSDGLPSLALGVDGAENDVMKRQPRPKKESFFSGSLGQTILIRGMLMGGVTYAMFLYANAQGFSLAYAQTLAFMTLIFGQLVQVFDSRTLSSIYRRNPFSNKALLLAVASSGLLSILMVYSGFGQLLLGTEAISAQHLGMAFAVGALPVLILSAVKEIFHIKWL